MRALLDVNLLIALFDEEHTHNKAAHRWLETDLAEGWATCPLTENGLIRILSAAGYSSTLRQTPADAAARLREFVESSDHEFWPDGLSIRDASRFQQERILSARQITGVYLLALAVEHGGRLVTFDKGIPVGAVTGAEPRHLTVL